MRDLESALCSDGECWSRIAGNARDAGRQRRRIAGFPAEMAAATRNGHAIRGLRRVSQRL